MPPRQRPKITKTKTFAGCWTCRRRKVKCDNRRPQCLRCGASCEGYDVDLFWMDEKEQGQRPCTVKRKAMLIRDSQLPTTCDLLEIDEMLYELDAIVEESGTGIAGAFSAFAAEEIEIIGDDAESTSSSTMSVETQLQLEMPMYLDSDRAELMHNYIHVVADLLQPAHHTQNPYRSIYAPRAMEAAVSCLVGVGGTLSQASTAVFHALLAVSAFHMHGYRPHMPRYERLGRLHRLKAVESLQRSLSSGETESDHHLIMSAMLSMVSIDLMEGSMSDFWIHLDGCEKLLLLMRNRVPSGDNQLLTICSFMSTLSRSTNPYITPKPWTRRLRSTPVSTEELLQTSPFSPDDHSLEFTYGITVKLASYMHLTISISEHLSFYQTYDLPLPASLDQARAALHQALTTWSITDEPLASVPDGHHETLSLVTCHILAFHASLIIYFHTLTGTSSGTSTQHPCCRASILRHYNRISVTNLLAAEALKLSHGMQLGWKAMAPIVWPGFIAACEAEPEERPLWRAWWMGVQKYCIGSIRTLWEVVQEVWEEDYSCSYEGDGDGDGDGPRWRRVLRRRGGRVMSG
ncbi:fungal-specific transcription factor domain-containing protein [Aspergillus cavernicola]|uniref:Fungal-specific transcription factor domain-containing protein n=1 Tax=Aspergillus cavernicola TaxID=176166 RepID=A0ABR4J0J8_9EURO